MNPFVSLNVQPAYGRREVLVSWQVLPGYEEGLFFLYRSLTGEAPWKMLNTVNSENVALAISGSSYIDESFVIENRVTDVHYRMLLRMPNGDEFESPVVSMFGKLTRRQWGGVCKMLAREYMRMRVGNGIEVLHYIPLSSGDINPNFDEDTGQHLSPDCIHSPDDSYGMKYKGGFAPPTATYIEFKDVGPIVFQDRDDGQGHDDPLIVRARMLAHPRPNRGHLIIHPASDNRYVVGDTIKGYYFRGIVAIGYDVTLHLLRRNDARYRVPIPEEVLFA
jgi:hypothetical protein